MSEQFSVFSDQFAVGWLAVGWLLWLVVFVRPWRER